LEPVVRLFFFHLSLQHQPSFSHLPDLHHMDYCEQCNGYYSKLWRHEYEYHSIIYPVSVLGKITPVERRASGIPCPSPTCGSEYQTRSSWRKHLIGVQHKDVTILPPPAKRPRDSSPSVPEEPSNKKVRPAATWPQWQAGDPTVGDPSSHMVECEASVAMPVGPRPWADASTGDMVESEPSYCAPCRLAA
jgi:hypothetical protein